MTTATNSEASQLVEEILAFGLKNADASIRVIRPLEPGEFAAQGDVIFWALEGKPDNVVPAEPNRQLAPGTSKGSRHCIREADMHKVEFYKFTNPSPLEGPVLFFKEDVVIEHPEHGDQVWTPQWVAVTYQLRHGDEVKRVQD